MPSPIRLATLTLVVAVVVVVAAFASCGCRRQAPSPAQEADGPVTAIALDRFAQTLESLRTALRIPGMSAAIVHDQHLAWSQGFGYADLEADSPAAPDTLYHLASVTKPFAAVLLMRLVEQNRLDLDTPITQFGIELENGESITVRHLLSHTSEGVPGSRYQYSGSRYAELTRVIEQLYEGSFRGILREQILGPLEMNDTVLNYGGCGLDYYLSTRAVDDPERTYEDVYRRLATPYHYDPAYELYAVPNPTYANAAAGLISTVEDLARFDIALDRDQLLQPETADRMFTPARLNSGEAAPYGLGWFAETLEGAPIVWHYGYGAYSSLYLKLPSENLTLIVLANTQNLSRPFQLGREGVSVITSPFALAFYKRFVLEPPLAKPLPEIDWAADLDDVVEQLSGIEDPELRALYERELWSYRMLYGGVGRTDIAATLLAAHSRAFPSSVKSYTDVYQVGRPGPRPQEPNYVALNDEERARWVGRYALQAGDAAEGLPSEVTLSAHGTDLIGVSPDAD